MIELTRLNTKGKISNYLATYKNIKCYKGDINDYVEWYKNFMANVDNKNMVVSLDLEASKLYPKNNFITHFILCYKYDNIYYSCCFNIRDVSNDFKARIFNSFNKFKSKIVLHNAYFDIGLIKFLHNVEVKWDYDTYNIFHTLMSHRSKEDSKDFGDGGDLGLGLKDLTRDYLEYGDYETDLEKEKKRICKEKGIKVKQFSYDMFEDEVISPYGCFDGICTLQLFEISLVLFKEFSKLGLSKLKEVINTKKLTTDIYIKAFTRGVNIDWDKCLELGNKFEEVREKSKKDFLKLYENEIIYTEKLYKLTELEKIMNESMIDYFTDTQQKGRKKGKTEKREDGKNYYKKGILLTDKQSEKVLENSEFSMDSPAKKTTLLVEVLRLKPLDKGTSVYEPKVSLPSDDIFSKCFGYKINKDTKKRERKLLSPKTDIAFIEHHLNVQPNLQSLLDYGKCNTALNTFLGVLKTEKDKKGIDGSTLAELTERGEYPYVYPSYNLLGTITSRCSCKLPNLQQIPSRGVLTPLKECFKAREGYKLYYADYSSAEVVILGSILNSKVIRESLENKWDLHSMNAWFMLKDEILKQKPEFELLYKECGKDKDKLKEFYGKIKENFEKTVRYKTKSLNKI